VFFQGHLRLFFLDDAGGVLPRLEDDVDVTGNQLHTAGGCTNETEWRGELAAGDTQSL
jgi:hypothetical protein